MLSRRWAAVVMALALLAWEETASAVGPGHPSPSVSSKVVGHDGITYDSAPLVVDGLEGDLFLGLEFDIICAWGGKLLAKGMRRVSRLARVIEDSGRRVVWTVAPNKTLINYDTVVKSSLPQGPCDVSGIEQQRKVLDHFADPAYLSLRKPLARDRRQTYWKTDPHWTSLGASDWVRVLAQELDPRIARQQRYVSSTLTAVGYLNTILGNHTPETVPDVVYAGKVKVKTAPGSAYELDPGGVLAMDHSWNSAPASRTWPGHTLLLGDSFSLVGLPVLRPLFRHGRYLWVGNVAPEDIARAIADSDTVVMEVVQFFMFGHLLGQSSFRKLVKKELRRHPHRTTSGQH